MKESALVVGARPGGRKPEDAKKAANLQNLAREYHKLDPDDYLARVTSVLRYEF
jgi:hypothetical protein